MLTIDLDALAGNYRLLREKAAGAECSAVVKADAYGLGIHRVARELAAAGCRCFFVATLDEALELRGLLAQAAIYVLNGLPPGSADEFTANALVPVLNSLGEIGTWGAHARAAGAKLPAVLHVDTGMNRLGLPPPEFERLAAEPERLEGLDLRFVISHLACADDPAHPKNAEQLALFERLAALLAPVPAGLAASSGIFLGPEFHLDLVRPGAALYGIAPTVGAPNPMAEVVRLQGKILQVRDVDSPMTVGYGAAHRVTGPARIATVAVGYADGFLRAFSQRGHGVVGDTRVAVVGRVSMDMITLDVSAVPPELAGPGARVDLIGGPLPLDEVAAQADTIGYEILTALGGRYRRVWRGGVAAR